MKIAFALSLTTPEQLETFRRTTFAAKIPLELSGELLDVSLPTRLNVSGIREIVPADLSRLIVGENLTVQLEFSRLFRRRCRRAAELGAQYVCADFDLSGTLRDPARTSDAAKLLPELLGIALRERMQMLLRLRLPAPEVPTEPELSAFRRRLLMPNLDFCLDFHPHEPGALEQLEKRVNAAITYWRINFEPTKGNRLTPALWEKFAGVMTQSIFNSAQVAICPGPALPDELLVQEIVSALPKLEE